LVAGQAIDVVTFYNKKFEPKPFGFRYNGQNDTLTLFNLVNSKPDTKGGYTVGTPAFKFSRKTFQ
ncbi:MAG TPA: hypothetical protein PKY28_10065, partial [Ferruginibacter sp.]|nr:hypothetical protein [Ferruginibacter sp.]